MKEMSEHKTYINGFKLCYNFANIDEPKLNEGQLKCPQMKMHL